MSRGKSRSRSLPTPDKRNIQPFAGSLISGRCLDPLKVAAAKVSCSNYRLHKEHKRREQNKRRQEIRVGD